jgi:hypothetical protein
MRPVRIQPGTSRRRSSHRRRQPKSEISIAFALWPAGSFLGDFRTPAGTRNSYMGKVNHNPPHIGIVGFPSRCRRSIWRVRLRDAVRDRTQSTLYSVRARAPVP